LAAVWSGGVRPSTYRWERGNDSRNIPLNRLPNTLNLDSTPPHRHLFIMSELPDKVGTIWQRGRRRHAWGTGAPWVLPPLPVFVLWACWYFLASLLRTGLGPIPSNGARNAVLASPSKDTKERQPIGLYNYRQCPQAHGSNVVAFHPEVFRVSLFIFY
jgi:hypothetical protein